VVRDDRILPETRWVFILLTPVLAAGVALLYGLPGRTEQLFAWTIRPDMTPMIMGAGYASGVYFFIRIATSSRWHRVGTPLPGIAAFAFSMLLATFLHWDRFNHDHISFIAWTAIYCVAPFIVIGLWWRNRQTDPGTPEVDDVVVPQFVRGAAGVVGGLVTLTGLVIFLSPDLAIDHAPWLLTQLTARVLAGWMIFPGVISLFLARDARWSSWRIPLQGTAVWVGLILLAIPRGWDDFTGGMSRTLFVIAIVAWLIAASGVYVVLESRRAQPGPAPEGAAPATGG
jgi:hypothetical protein